MDIITKFTELYIPTSDIYNTDLLYEFLQSIDYDSLDYENETNLLIIYNCIMYNEHYHNYTNFDKLLKIVLPKSEIIYNTIMRILSIEHYDYYNNIIKSLEPKNKFEQILYHRCLNYDKQKIYNEDIYKVLKEESLIIADNDVNLVKFINDIYSSPNIINSFDKVNKNNLHNIKTYLNRCYDTYKYNEIYLCIDLLKEKNINPYFIKISENRIILFENKIDDIEIYIKNMFDNIEKLYHIDIDNNLIKLKFKSRTLEYIMFNFLRCNNTNLYKYFEEYYNNNIYLFEKYKDTRSVISFNINYYSKLVNITKDNNKKKEYIEHLLQLKEITLNKYYKYELSIIDIMKCYRMLKIITNDSMYDEKIVEIYETHKDYICKNISQNMFIVFMNEIISILRDRHQIHLIREFEEKIPTEYLHIEFYKKEIACFKSILNKIKYADEIIIALGFKIIYESEIKEDVDICPICIEPIDKEKITVIECSGCNTYIGHFNCFCKYMDNKFTKKSNSISCILCRKKYFINYDIIKTIQTKYK